MILRNILLVAGLGAFLGGCGPYVEDFHYLPNPAIAEVRAAPSTQPATQPAQAASEEQSVATTSAMVVGLRRPDRGEQLPLSVEVRLQVDNHGPKTVSLDPRSLDLTTGALVRFPPPIVRGPERLDISPGQSLFVQANFPFPSGASYDNMDLHQLTLRWTLLVDNQPVGQAAGFQRMLHYYYDPYWDRPGYPYGPYYYGYSYAGFGGRIIIRR